MKHRAPEPGLSWAAFQAWRAGRPGRALHAAQRLVEGDTAPACRLLDRWSVMSTVAGNALLMDVLERPPRPTAALRSVSLAPTSALRPHAAGPLSSVAWRVHLAEVEGPSVADTLVARVAWALDMWATLPVGPRQPPPPDARDVRIRAQWAAVLDGQLWPTLGQWQKEFAASFRQGWGSVLLGLGCSRAMFFRHLPDLDAAFLDVLVDEGGPDGAEPMGWMEVAARVLEDAPIAERVGCLGTPLRVTAARCVASSPQLGHAAGTALGVPGLDRSALSLRLVDAMEPPLVARGAELHGLSALLRLWQDPARCGLRESLRGWGRARDRPAGRVRALLCASDPVALAPALLALPSLYASTRRAVVRYGQAQARLRISHGGGLPSAGRTTPACSVVAGPAPISPSQLEVVRTWVLLVVLRGSGADLARWVRGEGKAPRGDRWSRLFHTHLPRRLVDPQPRASRGVSSTRKRQTYARLRAFLGPCLPTLLRSLQGAVRDVAALPDGARRPDLVAVLQPHWSAEIAMPGSRFVDLRRHARAALAEGVLDGGPAWC